MYKTIIFASAFLLLLSQSTISLASDGTTATISLTEGIVVNKNVTDSDENTKDETVSKVDETKSSEKSMPALSLPGITARFSSSSSMYVS